MRGAHSVLGTRSQSHSQFLLLTPRKAANQLIQLTPTVLSFLSSQFAVVELPSCSPCPSAHRKLADSSQFPVPSSQPTIKWPTTPGQAPPSSEKGTLYGLFGSSSDCVFWAEGVASSVWGDARAYCILHNVSSGLAPAPAPAPSLAWMMSQTCEREVLQK